MAGNLFWSATWTLWQREMVRFFRQRNRIIGALATPLVIWLLLGFGLGKTFSPADVTDAEKVNYQQYFFPGVVSMMLLFTSIFTTFSVIEDRREGFMQGVLVAPVSRLAIVMGKVFGGASIAMIQGVLLLCIWPMVGSFPGIGSAAVTVGIMFIIAMGMTGLGMCFAWPMDSTAGFHAIMNLILMPLWVLSGAMFPVGTAPQPLKGLMVINPLTYGQTLLANWMTDGQVQTFAPGHPAIAWGVLIGFTLVIILLATRIVQRPRRDGT